MKLGLFVLSLAILCPTWAPVYPQSVAEIQFGVSTYMEPPPSPRFTAAKLGGSDKDVTYCITGGSELTLDIFYPTVQPSQKYPLVVWIHGGGLSGGAKGGFGPVGSDPNERAEYLARGYVLASINYRLGPVNKLPTMIEDAKCAIRYLRARAGSYNIDPKRIGVMGASSGGYLSVMLGLADAGAGFEGRGAFPGVSSRVQAVVAEAPQVSFELPSFSAGEMNSRNAVVPAGADAQFLHRVSLPTHVSPDDPPILFFHGEFDAFLSPGYSLDLNARLIAAGVDSTYVLVKRAGHGWLENPATAAPGFVMDRLPNTPFGPEPSRQTVFKQELDFFDKHLKN